MFKLMSKKIIAILCSKSLLLKTGLCNCFCHFSPYCFTECTRIPAETEPLSNPLCATRVLCGALILPTIATIVGKVMFGSVQSNFQRTLLVSLKKYNSIESTYLFIIILPIITTKTIQCHKSFIQFLE